MNTVQNKSIFSYVEQTGRAAEENTYPNIYYAGLSDKKRITCAIANKTYTCEIILI